MPPTASRPSSRGTRETCAGSQGNQEQRGPETAPRICPPLQSMEGARAHSIDITECWWQPEKVGAEWEWEAKESSFRNDIVYRLHKNENILSCKFAEGRGSKSRRSMFVIFFHELSHRQVDRKDNGEPPHFLSFVDCHSRRKRRRTWPRWRARGRIRSWPRGR